MDLYIDRLATTSRAVLALCEAERINLPIHPVVLMKGEHRHASFAALNPNCMVPVLVDGDLVITEASAILYHLARKVRSKLYPEGERVRARVDELVSWFGTNFYRDFGYQYVYPQILPQHRRSSAEANRATIEWGRVQSNRWLAVLNDHYLGPSRPWVAGDQLTVADYYGMSIVSLGDLVGCSLADYPNVLRWYRAMNDDESWRAVNAAFLAFAESIRVRGESFVGLRP